MIRLHAERACVGSLRIRFKARAGVVVRGVCELEAQELWPLEQSAA